MKTTRSKNLFRFALPSLAMAGLLALTSPRAQAADENVTGNLTVTGNVGFGTSSVDRPLVVSVSGGNEANSLDLGGPLAVFTTGSSWGGLRVMGTTQGYVQMYTYTNSLGGYIRVNDLGGSPATANFQLGFDHNDLIAMTVLDNGNVGIGTTTPSAVLDVNGGALINGDASVNGMATISGNADVAGEALISGNATMEADASVSGNLTVYSDALVGGYLGIGTATPGLPFVLSVSGGCETNGMGSLGGPMAVMSTGSTWGGLRIMGASQGYLQLYTATNSLGGYVRVIDAGGSPATAYMQLGFDHDSVIAMTLLDSGNVGIGTTSPTAALDVNGDVINTGTVNGEKIVISGTVNMKTTGNTTIYTPTAGKTFSVTSISVDNTAVTALTVPGHVTFSAGGTTNDLTTSLTLTSAAAGKEFKPAFVTQPFNCTSSAPLTLRITTASTATTHNVKIVVTGVEY